MGHIPDHAQQPDRPRSLEELRCRLKRRLSDLREGWTRCDNRSCRRWKQCCGEGPVFKCTDDGRPRRTLSEGEKAKIKSDLYKGVKRRCAERAPGAEPKQETPRELHHTARAAARRRHKSARALAAKTAAPSPSQVHRDQPHRSVVAQTRPAPQQQAPIDRARNDEAASQPAEQDNARERRPRITQL
jgi:hypothetical protein